MKTLITSAIIIFVTLVFAQAPPQGISYQAVATDAAGRELVNQPIGVRATVVSGSPSGTSEWIEEHSATTDQFGLFTIIIGQGTPAGGAQSAFANINWGSGSHYLKIEIDATGGTNYSLMGVDQMMSVPYALYAEKAGSADSITNINISNIDTDTTNEIQNIYLSGDTLFIEGGNYVILPDSSTDAWKLLGNAGTNASMNFLGTTDNVPLSFRVNNQNAGRIDHTLANTSLGHHALNSNTIGTGNTATGAAALDSNTTGINNTATGVQALQSNVIGSYNTAIGVSALGANITGSENTACGQQALLSNKTGIGNTAIGLYADVTSGSLTNATAIGYHAKVGASSSLVLGGTGVDAVNVGIGIITPTAMLHVKGGAVRVESATGLQVCELNDGGLRLYRDITGPTPGENGYIDFTDFPNQVDFRIGFNHTLGTSGGLHFHSGTNGIIINGSTSRMVILNSNGYVGIGDDSPSYMLHVNGTVAGVGAYVNASDSRYKKNVMPLEAGLTLIQKMKPVSYEWNQEAYPDINFGDKEQLGFIAQDMEKIVPEAVSKDDNGFYGMSYSTIIPVIVKAIQEQQEIINKQQTEIERLKLLAGEQDVKAENK